MKHRFIGEKSRVDLTRGATGGEFKKIAENIADISVFLPINHRFFAVLCRLRRAWLHSPMFRRFFGPPPIFRRYIGDFADFWPIFPSIDNRCRLSFRCRPITDISPKYRRHFPIFQSMALTIYPLNTATRN